MDAPTPLFRGADALVASGLLDVGTDVRFVGPGIDGWEVFVDHRLVAVLRLDPDTDEADLSRALAKARERRARQ